MAYISWNALKRQVMLNVVSILTAGYLIHKTVGHRLGVGLCLILQYNYDKYATRCTGEDQRLHTTNVMHALPMDEVRYLLQCLL